MSRFFRVRKTSRPCLMAELLEEMAARQSAYGVPARDPIPLRPLSRGEKLLLHLSLFMVGSGSLVMINLGRDPQHLWFWPWVAGWAGLLLLHGAVVLAKGLTRPAPVPNGNPPRARPGR